MKKLICALVLLAMLVPVAAMAADLPATRPDHGSALTFHANHSNMGDARFSYSIQYNNKYSCTGNYSMTGDLMNYTCGFDCGCHVSFFPDGTILDSDNPNCSATHSAPFIFDNEVIKEPSRPADDITELLKTDDSFASLKEELTTGIDTLDFTYDSLTGSLTINKWPDCDVLYIDGKYVTPHTQSMIISEKLPNDGVPVLMIKGEKAALYTSTRLRQVYIDSILYHFRQNKLRLYNDGDYSTRVFVDYDIDTGMMDHYGITTKDGRLKTVYSANNILMTHEYWSNTDGKYWLYEDGIWYSSTTGQIEEDMSPEAPSTEVLDAITLAPTPAIYNFGLTSSANNLPKDQPSIIGNAAAIGGSTPKVTSTAENSRTTKYELELVGSTDELNEGVYVALPLNAGITKSLLETELDLTIEHNGDVYSTMDNSITLKDGLAVIYTESFSPFNMTWGEEGTLESGKSPTPTFSLEGVGSTSGIENLPSTGDSSNLLAYACLLLASAAMFVMLKRRAHQ